jgi:myo-inositol 2-dehydrogenase/D-chiro-inositol 1-dehydrogenase
VSTRVGLIGAGGVAQRHARILSDLEQVQIVGVTDVTPAAAESLAGQYGGRAFSDVESLLAEGLDAVYICIPPFAHGPAEHAVISAGIPFFAEKPIALEMDTAQEIARLVAQRDLLTSVGHHWRYLDVVEQARALLQGRQIRLVTGAWLDKVPPVAWWPHRDRSGGPIVEQAAHVLDLARHLAGEVVEVTAVADPTPPAVDGADVAGATAATLRFASGAVGTLAATCVLGWKERAGLEIYADGLALAISETGLVIRTADGVRTVDSDPESARIAVDRAFIEAVRGEGTDVRVPYAEALRTHALALAVAEAADSGRAVTPRSPVDSHA